MTWEQMVVLAGWVRRALIGTAQVLVWWSLVVATAGVASALWLLIWPTMRRVVWS